MSVAQLRELERYEMGDRAVVVCANPGFMKTGSLVGHTVTIDGEDYLVRGSETDLIPLPHIQGYLGLLVDSDSYSDQYGDEAP